MKKHVQLLSVAVLGIAIPLLALEVSLGDLARGLDEVTRHLGGAKPGVGGAYNPKNPGIAVAVIDVQPTFMFKSLDGGTKDGELPVPGTDGDYPQAVVAMNDFLGASIISQDWHPQGHVSWASGFGVQIPKRDPLLGKVMPINPYKITVPNLIKNSKKWKLLRGGAPITGYPVAVGELLAIDPEAKLYVSGYKGTKLPASDKLLWPDHSIQNSPGAEIYPDVYKSARGDIIVRKGMNTDFDSFSVMKDDDGTYTEFREILKAANITDIINYGIATDYCVKRSVLHEIAEGFRAHVVINLCRGVTWDTTISAIKEMQFVGARIYYVGGLNDGWDQKEKLEKFAEAGINPTVVASKEEFLAMVIQASKTPKAPKLPERTLAQAIKDTANIEFKDVEQALDFFKSLNAVMGDNTFENARIVTPLVKVDLVKLGFGAATAPALKGAIEALDKLGVRFEEYNALEEYMKQSGMKNFDPDTNKRNAAFNAAAASKLIRAEEK